MKKLLIIEDDESVLDSLSIYLGKYYQVNTLKDLNGALAHIVIKEPDLILLDILFSESDGRLLCRQLKTSADLKRIPVVLMSAGNFTEKQIRPCKPDAFIPKPFALKDVLKTLQKVSGE
ncbi:MAG: response regulator [Chitinophagaceae bacterium]|nr:response regulator [Chitinophagaceae bacterium]